MKTNYKQQKKAMTRLEERCRDLWRQIVKLRDGWCYLCGQAYDLEAHHIFFLSAGDWKLLYDTDFGVTLCPECHQHRPHAPHKDNQAFFDRIVPRLPEDRRRKILEYAISVKKPQTEKPDWRAIRARLQRELKYLEDTRHMDP